MNESKRMTIQDIVKHDCERAGSSFETVYVNLHNSIQNNTARVFRSGNTLFTSEIQEPKVSEVHMFTADKANQLVKAIREFVSAMKAAGFVKLITNTDDESLLLLLKRANVNFTSMPTQNGFQIEIEV
jgi:acetylglutamate synthase